MSRNNANGSSSFNSPPPPPAQPQQNHICRVCRRQFNRRQALSGHMRLHGNRGWRSVCPHFFNRGYLANVPPILGIAAVGGQVAAAPPPPIAAPPVDNAPLAQPDAAATLPDLNEPRYYHVPDLNFPPPPA